MTIFLHIYFVGMIAFVPGTNEMTVLLPDIRHGYVASDGQMVEPHTAFLVARAGDCDGDCTADQEQIAEMLYGELLSGPLEKPMDFLGKAIQRGGVWELKDSDLVIEAGPPTRKMGGFRVVRSEGERALMPGSSKDRESFDWVARIGDVVPDSGRIDPGLLVDRPRRGQLVARLHLAEGEFRTHRMIRVGDYVRSVDFKTLRGDGQVVASGALAHWVVAEIPIHLSPEDCTIRLLDRGFDDGKEKRRMEIEPARCEDGSVIEVAILNVPTESFKPAPKKVMPEHRIGRHFEVYYELSSRPPGRDERPVPYTVEADGGARWANLHPKEEESSDFLASIVLEPGRGISSPLLCPPGRFDP